MEGAAAVHHAPVDGLCPRCGTEVSEMSRRCRECLLQLQPSDDASEGRTAMLRRVWEEEHPQQADAFAQWAAAPEGPPPGVTDPVRPPEPPPPALEPWKPLDGRMKRVVIVLAALAVLDMVAIVADVMEINLLTRVQEGESITQSEADSNDSRMALIGSLQSLLTVAAAITFIMWFVRAYDNVGAIPGGKRRYAQFWAIFGWFIPIMSVFRPKQIVNDLWAAGAKHYDDAKPTFLLAAWWGLFIVSWIITRFIIRRWDAEEIDEMIELDRAFVASDAVDAVGAVLAIMVVTRITRRMKARHEESVAPEPVAPAVSPPAPAAAPPA